MKRIMMIALALCLVAGTARALTMTGLETETLGRSWEDSAFFPRMEALTGIAVEAHAESESAKYQELLASMLKGEIPADVLFKASLSREQEIALLDSGAIIDLAPLLEENMPNLCALLEAHPEWRGIITLDDGRIASLPQINAKERQVCLWINRDWLDKLGLPMPQTTDELTDALLAMASSDLNSNGKQDEIGADLLGVYEMRWLLPYFGIVADDYNLARDAQGRIVFAPELAGYRAFIGLLADWTARGILREDAFTGMHSTQVLSGSDEDETVVSGLMLSATPYTHVPAAAVTGYEPLLITGPDGQTRWRDLLGAVWTGCFAVTSRCEDPAQALRWVDALYGEAGALLGYAGVEGEDYTLGADGDWAFALDGRRDVTAIRTQVLMYTGTAMPGLVPSDFIHRVDSAVDQHVFAASERVRAVSERVTQPYALGQAEQARADALAAQLGALVDCGIARFATGEVELNDETYAAWLDELRAAGSGELVALFADGAH
ncbi:MAG: hypothetical protein ACI4PG_05920 [Candidatus Ventricola sp.]